MDVRPKDRSHWAPKRWAWKATRQSGPHLLPCWAHFLSMDSENAVRGVPRTSGPSITVRTRNPNTLILLEKRVSPSSGLEGWEPPLNLLSASVFCLLVPKDWTCEKFEIKFWSQQIWLRSNICTKYV